MNSEMNESLEALPAVVFDKVFATKSTSSKSKSPVEINDVTFYVLQGEAVGLIARNIDGAALIVEAISGSLKPSGGVVLVRDLIAWIDSNSEFLPQETLSSNLSRAGMYLGINGSALSKLVSSTVEQLDLLEVAHQPVEDLDQLDVERARLLLAFLAKPSLIVIKDPKVRGEALTEERGRLLLAEYLENGGAVLCIDESSRTLRRFCQRMAWLREGSIIMDGTRSDVSKEYNRSVSFSDDKVKLAQLFRRYKRQYGGLTLELE